MEKHIDILHQKIDSVEKKVDIAIEKLHQQNEVLIRNTMIVDEHQRRSTALETELKPIKDHVNLMNNLTKIIVAVGAGLIGLNQLGILDKLLAILK
jgi:hypothetical protein